MAWGLAVMKTPKLPRMLMSGKYSTSVFGGILTIDQVIERLDEREFSLS